jgi:hypothetical protein
MPSEETRKLLVQGCDSSRIKNIALATQKEPSAATAIVARLDFEFSPVRRRRCKSTRKRRTGLAKTPRPRLAATSKYDTVAGAQESMVAPIRFCARSSSIGPYTAEGWCNQ